MVNTDVPLRGAQLKFTYDPHVVQLDSVDAGTFFEDWARAHGANASLVFPFKPDNSIGQTAVGGIVLFGGPPHDGPIGAGVLLHVHLTALADAPATQSVVEVPIPASSACRGVAGQNMPYPLQSAWGSLSGRSCTAW